MIRNFKYCQRIVKFISLLYVLLFVYAAISKFLNFETFKLQLAQSPLLAAYAEFISWAVPVTEIVIAILLIIPLFWTSAFYASFLLMVIFTAYIFAILNFSDFVPCSCGGVLEKMSWSQHLIFNLAFVVMAGFAILSNKQFNVKKELLLLGSLVLIGVGIVILLFAFSEKKIHRNNAFQRRYLPHFAQVQKVYDLHYNSWYFAGINSGKVYLGNVTAPLKMLILDTLFEKVDTVQIKLDNMEYPFRDVRVAVGDSNIFVTDGTVPIVYQGSKKTWYSRACSTVPPFTATVPLDSCRLGIRAVNRKTLKNIIGTIAIRDTNCGIKITDNSLPAKKDGIFESDGQLLWNSELHKMIYTYFYSNRYFTISPNLDETMAFRTIDTVSTPNIETLHFPATGQEKLKKNIPVINAYATTSGKYLFIRSNRLGRFESEEMLKHASIIDVYNLLDYTYAFSFYLYDHKEKKATSFQVKGNHLYAIMEDQLVKFELNKNIFKIY